MACNACLVCFISTVNGRNKKRKEKKPIKTCTSSRHITNLKQSIMETFDIYGFFQHFLLFVLLGSCRVLTLPPETDSTKLFTVVK